jgi:hypothetical protein
MNSLGAKLEILPPETKVEALSLSREAKRLLEVPVSLLPLRCLILRVITKPSGQYLKPWL